MDENKKVHKLSIFLIKQGNMDYRKILKDKVSVAEYKIKDDLKIDGIIFVGKTKSNTSSWKDLLESGTDKQLPDLDNSSNRAILFLKVKNRVFAIPFGYGKNLIKEELIERDFGLKTVLNLVNADKLRNIDKSNLDNLTVQTRTQTSRKAKPEEFNLDIIRDLLKGVTGEIETQNDLLGGIISGSDGVFILPKIEFVDIPKGLEILITSYESKKYQNRFGWIDNLKYERDPGIIAVLEGKLIEDLKKKNTTHIHLGVPDIIEWTAFEGISYTPKGEPVPDLEIESFYDYKSDSLKELDWEKLLKIKLYVRVSNQDEGTTFSLWRCLNYEVEYNSLIYIFAFGNWYKVNKKYSDEIKDYVKQIKESDLNFTKWDGTSNEGDYNIALAGSSGNFLLMDKKLVRTDLTRSDIEACDVLAKSKEFIHVKVKKGSSTLSHLFAQGKISAQLLKKDRTFRKNLRAKISSLGFNRDLISLEKGDFDASKFTITFALLDQKNKPFMECLPFFSLLNFMLTTLDLIDLGFDVRVKKI